MIILARRLLPAGAATAKMDAASIGQCLRQDIVWSRAAGPCVEVCALQPGICAPTAAATLPVQPS